MVLVHAHRHLQWRLASLVLGRWKHACFSFGTLNHLAAHVVPSWRRALRVAPWSHTLGLMMAPRAGGGGGAPCTMLPATGGC